MNRTTLVSTFLLLAATPLAATEEPARFSRLSAADTGIDFANTIVQDATINLYTFEYLYNGAGVAIGDVDNDGLPDLYFAATRGSDRLYRNLGGFRFEDVSERAGIAAAGGLKGGVAMADVNGDGWLDVYVSRSGLVAGPELDDLLWINDGDGTFTERAAEFGLADGTRTTQATFFDYDLDGDLDLFLVNFLTDRSGNQIRVQQQGDQLVRLRGASHPSESDRLYRNEGGVRFTDVSKEAGIDTRAFGLSATATDLDGDGWPDLYVANDFIEPDYALINNRDGTFTDRRAEMFRHVSYTAMGSDAADVDNDGHTDVVVADMVAPDNFRRKSLLNVMVWDRYSTLVRYGYGHQLQRNTLQLNNRNGTFSEIGELAGVAATDWSWAPLLADFDNDGWKDLYVTNGYRYDVNDGDYFKFTLDRLNRSVRLDSDESLAYYLQHIPTAPLPNYMFRNAGGLRFEDVSAPWGLAEPSYSTGAAYGDLDRDGDLDLVVSNIDQEAFVLRNETRPADGDRHYLQIALEGPPLNRAGIGARVEVEAGGATQMAEMFTTRGFMSAVEPLLHFGLGAGREATVTVRWPGGRSQVLARVAVDRRLVLRYQDAAPGAAPVPAAPARPLLTPLAAGLDFVHRENDFVDFKREPLLPHMLSRSGPCLATGDVDGDGLEDLFAGGAAGQAGVVLRQRADGTFEATAQPALDTDAELEDVGAALFDADGDGDLDLYVVSGGTEFEAGSAQYLDRFYRNDGAGRFARDSEALPNETASGSCVRPADYDGDGDLDLFVGGRVVPGSYPAAPQSLLLRNDGGRFVDVGAEALPRRDLGLVTAAAWADLDRDGAPELVLAGEWMPVTVLARRDGRFVDVTAERGLGETSGWWHSLEAADLDGDGDLDLAAGNLGRNSRLRASVEEPLRIYAKDFDANGSLDAVMSWYDRGTEHPLPQKDLLTGQLPSLKKKFLRYRPYAAATMADVFPAEQLADALELEAHRLESTWFEQREDGTFAAHELPLEAQVAPVQGILPGDLDGDGLIDLLLVGNSFETEVETGRFDAFNGLLLRGTKEGWRPVHATESGFFFPANGRYLVRLRRADGSSLIVAAGNDGPLTGFVLDKPTQRGE